MPGRILHHRYFGPIRWPIHRSVQNVYGRIMNQQGKILFPLLVCIFWICSLQNNLQAQEKPVYKIGVLLDRLSPERGDIFENLTGEIRAVVGEDAQLEFPTSSLLINDFDLAKATLHYHQLIEGSSDIILAFGPVSSEVITKQSVHEKPTILFGAINNDLVNIDTTKTSSGIDNFTYVLTTQSYQRDLSTFKDIYDFKKVGILIADSQSEVHSYNETLSRIVRGLGADFEIIDYSELDDLRQALDRVDAVYLAEGFDITAADIESMAMLLIERQIPSFSSTRKEDVVSGWLATNQSEENFQQLFRRIALNIEAVISGENLADRPIYLEQGESLTLNYNTAEALGIPIKYSSIATTQFVGDFVNVRSLKDYTLTELIDEVLENNFSLESSRRDVALSQQDLRKAKSNYLPSITGAASGSKLDSDLAEASGGQNPEYTTTGNISVSQVIYSAGASSAIGIQKDLLAAQKENYDADELDLILTAAQVYFNTLAIKANAQIRQQNLDVTSQNLKIAEQNFEAGQAGKSDLLRFKSEAAQNTQSLIEAVNQLEQAFYSINQLVGESIDREIDVEDAAIEEGVFENYNYDQIREYIDDPSSRKIFVDFLLEEAMRNAPELRNLDYNISAVDRNIQLNGTRFFLPTLAAQAQYNQTFDQWGAGAPPPEAMTIDNYYSVGLNLSIPIFDQNSRRINKQTGILQKEQLEIGRSNSELAIERNVHDAVLDLINQITNIELSKISVQTAEEGLELTQTAYSTGAVNIVQLIDAQSNFLQAQLVRANANYNYLLSSLGMERSIGYFFLLHTDEENNAFLFRYLDFQNEATN